MVDSVSDQDWRLKSSFGLDPTLNSFAFSNDAMFERYRDPEHIPPRIRARLYFVKAVCIDAGSGLPNPYLDIQVGEHSISMRNMCQMQTNTPDFHRIEARDIQFPHDSRLEVLWRTNGYCLMQDGARSILSHFAHCMLELS